MELKVIGYIHNDYTAKFGIPHQSGRVESVESTIIFESKYRNPDAFRGIEEYTHLWLIWEFSQAKREEFSPTVRPPRLGGNVRKGVFSTRSPFRPNPIGLSCVRLLKVEFDDRLGPVLHVAGADLMDKTPIYDIKPYLPYVDSHPEASGGFTDRITDHKLIVEFPLPWLEMVPAGRRQALKDVLADDPRPGYQNDPDRVYGMKFADQDIHFQVKDRVLTVCGVTPADGIFYRDGR